MASSAFQALYGRALRKEHAILDQSMLLWSDKTVSSFPIAVRGAKVLLAQYEIFVDDLEAVVRRHQMLLRQPLRDNQCPHCGSTECADAPGGISSLPSLKELKDMLLNPPPSLDPPSHF